MTGFASLINGLDPKQDPPYELLDLLGATLRSRMEKTGLWEKAPKVLGYDTLTCWSEPAAFRVLQEDCYEVCIRRRLAQLQQSDERNGKLDRRVTGWIDAFLVNFTTLIRQLEPDREPSLELIQQLLELLERAIRRQLRRSNFFHQTPAKLGVSAGRGGWRDSEAMSELIGEAYGRCLGRRTDWLKSRIAMGKPIDDCIKLGVKQLIIDRWRKHSPYEYKLYKNPECVVQSMEQAKEVFVSPEKRKGEGKVELTPASLVSFAVKVDEQPVATKEALREALRSTPQWIKEVEQLVHNKAARKIIEAGIYRIRQSGIIYFRFGDLQGVLREEYEREIGIPQFENMPAEMHHEAVLGGPSSILWDTQAVHRQIEQSDFQVKVKQRLHAIEDIQFAAVKAEEGVLGPTELGNLWKIPKQTASDYLQRWESIWREVHLDQ